MELIKDLGIRRLYNWKRGERFGLFRCPVCGELVEKITKDALKAKWCSHKCYAKMRTQRGPYKRKIISRKYVYIYKPNHPHAIGTKKLYVAEHRLVMEDYLGRYLTSSEIVHHKDENTLNNTISNLELMTAIKHNKYHSQKRGRKNGVFTV